MLNTQLDLDLYNVIEDIQDIIDEIKNELLGEGLPLYNKEVMLDKLNVIICEIQEAL